MRVYVVKIGNDAEYSYNGGMNKEFVVLAYDITEAVMTGLEVIHTLREKLQAVNHPEADTLRIKEVEERYVIIGQIGFRPSEGSLEDWVDQQVKSAKKDM